MVVTIYEISVWWRKIMQILTLGSRAPDSETACEDGGVLVWFRERWLRRQFDTISGHHTIPYHATPCHTIPYLIILHHAIQYGPKHGMLWRQFDTISGHQSLNHQARTKRSPPHSTWLRRNLFQKHSLFTVFFPAAWNIVHSLTCPKISFPTQLQLSFLCWQLQPLKLQTI